MKQERKNFGKNGRTQMTKTTYCTGHHPKNRDHNMENITIMLDVKFSGLTEKTAMFEMKQSTKLPRHYIPFTFTAT
jgi:hypothetical protein